ncbi:tetratricopeptide repeat protein [bacterium]|nr:tetratricopeptide repeat protein [bacterium]
MKRIPILIAIFAISLFANELDAFFSKPTEYKRTDKPLSEMVRDLENNLNNPEYLYNYAWSAYEENDFETAKRYIEKAVALRPQNAFLHFKAGQIYIAANDNQNAKKHFEKALENHYEYLDAWVELIKIAPEYYYNLAQLYSEKAHQVLKDELADKAIEHYQNYIDNNSGGEFIESAKAGIRNMNLLKSELKSKERIKSAKANQHQAYTDRKLAQKKEMQQFRSNRRIFVGFALSTFSPSDNYVFRLREDKQSLTDTIALKEIMTSISEYSINGGYFVGPFILRGALLIGQNGVKYQYVKDSITVDTIYNDTTIIGDDTTYADTFIVKRAIHNLIGSVNTLRFSAEGIYNFYYANPLLLYGSAGFDIGYIYISEKESYFETINLSGAGIGGGVMLRFGNFLIDLGYKYNIVGSSKGGILAVGGIFKF